MHKLPAAFVFAAVAFAQTGEFGSFTHSADIGDPPMKGSAQYDATTGEYKITGSGSDIWGKADQFHYVWREMSGNFAVAATAKFLTEGIGHRKAVIMLRKTTDTDSPFVQLAIHGDGTPALQFRNTKADNTNTVDFPVEGPGTWKMKLVRQGGNITVWMAKDGAPLKELGHTPNQIGNPILVGLGVSSHTREATNTVLFSDVSIEQLPAPGATPNLGIFTNAGDVGGPAIKGSAEFSNGQYRITGAGTNIWAKQDQFQYVWREITGNFTATATLRFVGTGADHRKAGIMARQTLDSDSAYADVVIHGNGMPGLQWRSKQGEDTNAFDLPFDGPGTFQIKLVRTGVRMFLFLGKEGAELKEIAHTEVSFKGPVLVGLAVCSHQAGVAETAIFSDVSISPQLDPSRLEDHAADRAKIQSKSKGLVFVAGATGFGFSRIVLTFGAFSESRVTIRSSAPGCANQRDAENSSRWMTFRSASTWTRAQVTINDGRWRAGVPVFGHPAPEVITDSPPVLKRIKHLKSEAKLH